MSGLKKYFYDQKVGFLLIETIEKWGFSHCDSKCFDMTDLLVGHATGLINLQIHNFVKQQDCFITMPHRSIYLGASVVQFYP